MDTFESTYKNKGLVNFCSFEQGNIMVSLRAIVQMLESARIYEGFINYG